MSLWRVKMEVYADTQLKRDTLVAAFDSELVGKTIHSTPRSTTFRDNGRFAGVRDVRLASNTEATAIFTAMSATMNLQRNGYTGKLSLHECTHLDPTIEDCEGKNYQELVI